MEKMMTRGHK